MVLVTPENIAAVMTLSPAPHSFAELDDFVSSGLPKSALPSSVNHVFIGTEDRKKLLHQIVPEATYKRRRERLTAEESERTERLARIFATTQYVWDSDSDARAFLNSPHSMLAGKTPLEVSMTEIGARRVEELLWKLHFGVAA